MYTTTETNTAPIKHPKSMQHNNIQKRSKTRPQTTPQQPSQPRDTPPLPNPNTQHPTRTGDMSSPQVTSMKHHNTPTQTCDLAQHPTETNEHRKPTDSAPPTESSSGTSQHQPEPRSPTSSPPTTPPPSPSPTPPPNSSHSPLHTPQTAPSHTPNTRKSPPTVGGPNATLNSKDRPGCCGPVHCHLPIYAQTNHNNAIRVGILQTRSDRIRVLSGR